MIIIQASNIHNGGGAVLLKDILTSQVLFDVPDVIVFVDERFDFSFAEKFKIIRVKPTILSRLAVEFKIQSLARKHGAASVHYFGNLPPLMPIKAQVSLFFQNVILLDKFSNFKFPLKVRIKQKIERLWLKYGMQFVDRVFVQSETVKTNFINQFNFNHVEVLAFNSMESNKQSKSTSRQGFLYVASAEPHKNHKQLMIAWMLLHKNGLSPDLILTTRQFDSETSKIFNEAVKAGVKITVHENLNHQAVLNFYNSSLALVYPSYAESFGLPLLEAKRANLPILASELDYVRDLSEPVQTFDPTSAVSIARAVQRFLNEQELCKTKIMTADDFIKVICSGKLGENINK